MKSKIFYWPVAIAIALLTTPALQASPLHDAASVGFRDVVEALIEAKVEINARDNNGFSAVGYALRSGNQEEADFL